MLEWLVVLCAAVLIFIIWSTSKVSGTEKRRKTALKEPDSPMKDDDRGRSVKLICKPSALANYLLKNCASFNSYSPWVGWTWRTNAVLQSLYETCWSYGSPVHFVRDNLQLSDDGLVALDWAFPSYQKRRRTSSHSTSPVLLIIPNSFGKITRNVLQLCQAALSHGYLPAVFNRRSHNGTPLTTVKLQQFGDPADLREAVRYIRYRHPAGKLYAVSESTGSGLLLSYLGECGSSSYLTAAVCLSPVFRCQSWFENGLCWPMQWGLALYQKMCLSRYKTVLSAAIRTDTLFSTSSLRGLEEVLFCQSDQVDCASAAPTGTCTSWEAYWERNEPLRDVDEVAIPVLSVCARDDPVRGNTQATVPWELFENNPHFFLLLTDRGGHCGFSTQCEGSSSVPANPAAAPNSGTANHETNWSHRALLEFFRVTTDFFAAEERTKQLAARRKGLGGGAGGRVFRHRSRGACFPLPNAFSRMPTLQRNSSLAFWKSVGIVLGPRYSSEQDHIYHTAIKRPCITSQSHVKPIHFGNGQTTSEYPNLLFKCRGRIGRNSEAVASHPKNGFRSTAHLPELLPRKYPAKVMRDCTIPYA